MSKNDGGPAFPTSLETTDTGAPVRWPTQGMTLRDYYKAAAIDRCIEVIAQFVMDEEGFVPGQRTLSEVVARSSILAGAVADAMLAEREKP